MKKITLTAILAAVLGVVSPAHGDTVLQLDFGTAAGTYVGNLAPAGIPETVWNGVPNGDTLSGLVFGDGTAATGVSVELGAAPGGGTIDFLTDDARSNAGNADDQNVAIYDTALTDDWVFDSGGADIGARITGLTPGDYLVYAISREPNELARTYDVGIGAFTAANANSITSGSIELETTSIGDATGTTAFVAGQNFAVSTVTIADLSDFIAVVVDPTNGNGEERFATLSAIQIVAVPEPSSLAVLTFGGLGLLLRRRR